MFLLNINAEQEAHFSFYYYLVSAAGALGFSWLFIVLGMDAWMRFEWRTRSAVLLSFLFLSVGALLIYYFYLLGLKRRQEAS